MRRARSSISRVGPPPPSPWPNGISDQFDHAESWKGTLAPGMIADLCVLEADPFSVEPAALPDVPIKMTVVGGRVVYEP